jgi:hypothetical protein
VGKEEGRAWTIDGRTCIVPMLLNPYGPMPVAFVLD